jgi:hypothetical protein
LKEFQLFFFIFSLIFSPFPLFSFTNLSSKKKVPQKALRNADSFSTTSLRLSFPKQTPQKVKPTPTKAHPICSTSLLF